MAVWAVERIFDIAAFAVLLILAIFLPGTARAVSSRLWRGENFWFFFLALCWWAIARGNPGGTIRGEAVNSLMGGAPFPIWLQNLRTGLPNRCGSFIAGWIPSMAQWLSSKFAGSRWGCGLASRLSYLQVIHAYGTALAGMTLSEVFPLMGSSMVGSLIQLPGVGGGSQLATISVLQHIFGVPHELAAACGILLWLATFVSVFRWV